MYVGIYIISICTWSVTCCIAKNQSEESKVRMVVKVV